MRMTKTVPKQSDSAKNSSKTESDSAKKILLTISALGVIIPASTLRGSDYDY